MVVSPGQVPTVDPAERGVRARTMRLMLDTAAGLMQDGRSPSVSDVAEAAGVSRATSYRYFPSQAAMVNAVVSEALGPILEWTPRSAEVGARVADLMKVALRRIDAFEPTFRAALQLTLEQWAKGRAGTLGAEAPLSRGHRLELLQEAIAPLRGQASDRDLDRLARGLSLIFGIEAFVVLKDIWKLEQGEVEDTINWVAQVLVASVEGKAQR